MRFAFVTLPNTTDPDVSVTECVFWPGCKEIFMDIPGFPHPLQQPSGAKPAFRLGVSSGRGIGLFSTRALTQGELILAERPLLLGLACIPMLRPDGGLTDAQYTRHCFETMERTLEPALGRMRPARRGAFMALANCQDGSFPLGGRYHTNGIAVDGLRPGVTGSMGTYSAVCEHLSRLNHSCSPNTQPCFDKASISHQLWAVRDIAAGEELTFQYSEATCSAAERNEALKPYNFTCTCASCADPATSDPRRRAIGYPPSVEMWAANRELSDDWLIQKCLEQLVLIKREKLEYLDQYYAAMMHLTATYICLGDAKQASEWAARAQKCVWMSGRGYISQEELLDPASAAYPEHPLWRLRFRAG
ncbi:hypothetical protein GGX14DRAFT_362318 [Mycena pura]|uniref:SET domain-containing protein n=1 Tax=Mycena pura TaxID=153505 RepID=A0AAD6VG88_9AGAR|nr:hypothetical protein GGX14DRAFT_362318 [Mycena pura]